MTKKYLVLAFVLLAACVHDRQPSVCGYSISVKPIILGRCALPACHAEGSSLGDFTIDSVVKVKADIGWIRRNVFELKIMPPASAAPLTDKEKETLKCWLDNGAPQD